VVLRRGPPGGSRRGHDEAGRLVTSAVVLAAAVAAVVAGDARVIGASGQPAIAAPCRHIGGPFHRHKNMITGAGGQRYIPYGIVVTGLGSPRWKANSPGDDAEIDAAAASWCSNTVRLQVFQYALLGPGKTGVTVNRTFLRLIKDEVARGLNDGLVVVINDQTEGGGNKYFPGMPTTQTEAFWKVMSRWYGQNPDVIFDLFNEPRRAVYPTEAGTWKFWKHGGGYEGHPFIGMEPLARYVRGLGARNLFWIEGRTPPGRWTKSSTTRSPTPGRWSTRSTIRAGRTPRTTRPSGTPGSGTPPGRSDDRRRVDQLFIDPVLLGERTDERPGVPALPGQPRDGPDGVDADPGRARRVC